jgi:hypothetical protein
VQATCRLQDEWNGVCRRREAKAPAGQLLGSLGSALGSALGVPLDHLDALALAAPQLAQTFPGSASQSRVSQVIQQPQPGKKP